MTENQIGILIAVILLTIMFTPMIIYSIREKIKEIKYKNAFKSYPKQEKIKKEEPKTYQDPKEQIYQSQNQQNSQQTNKKPFIESNDDNWEEFYRTTIEPYYKKPYKPTQQQYQQKGEKLPYQLKPSVMTNHEKIMFNLLTEYCRANKLVLLSKVRIADFIDPIYKSYTKEFYQWFNKINCKHIDFLVCEPNTLRPLIAIELDDYTHKFNNRKERDIFIDNVYSSVNLPIVHFWDINENNIRIQLNNILGVPNETKI